MPTAIFRTQFCFVVLRRHRRVVSHFNVCALIKSNPLAGIRMRTEDQTIDFARWLARHSEMAWFIFRERRRATVGAPESDMFVASDEPPAPFRPCSAATPTGAVNRHLSPDTI